MSRSSTCALSKARRKRACSKTHLYLSVCMKGSFVSTGTFVGVRDRKWYRNVNVWIVLSIVVLLLMVIVFTCVLMYRRSQRGTHVQRNRASSELAFSRSEHAYSLHSHKRQHLFWSIRTVPTECSIEEKSRSAIQAPGGFHSGIDFQSIEL